MDHNHPYNDKTNLVLFGMIAEYILLLEFVGYIIERVIIQLIQQCMCIATLQRKFNRLREICMGLGLV